MLHVWPFQTQLLLLLFFLISRYQEGLKKNKELQDLKEDEEEQKSESPEEPEEVEETEDEEKDQRSRWEACIWRPCHC